MRRKTAFWLAWAGLAAVLVPIGFAVARAGRCSEVPSFDADSVAERLRLENAWLRDHAQAPETLDDERFNVTISYSEPQPIQQDHALLGDDTIWKLAYLKLGTSTQNGFYHFTISPARDAAADRRSLFFSMFESHLSGLGQSAATMAGTAGAPGPMVDSASNAAGAVDGMKTGYAQLGLPVTGAVFVDVADSEWRTLVTALSPGATIAATESGCDPLPPLAPQGEIDWAEYSAELAASLDEQAQEEPARPLEPVENVPMRSAQPAPVED